ncbi:MAG: class I SAM-dependent methyltransferase [Rhodococcus sp. (in: high G+C Gram-positive bacteria)]
MRKVTDAQVDAIPGWFQPYDRDLFRVLLPATHDLLGGGDLAELGAYQGKSAVVVGADTREGEVFTVIDLFGAEAPDADNQAENDDQYADLSRDSFERYYLGVHSSLPEIVTAPSATIVNHASAGTHRFVHVDASHLFEHVVLDIEAVRRLLAPGGVVVFDDIRSEHTPGVAAAVWRATANGLHPFAITPVKLYATFGDPRPWFEVIRDWAETSKSGHEVQTIDGLSVVRIVEPKLAEPPVWRAYVPARLMPIAHRVRHVLARQRAS